MSHPQPGFDAPAADWLVYADALQQAGDVRGALIVLNNAARESDQGRERDAYVAANASALYGDVPGDVIAFDWGLGAENVTLRVASSDDAITHTKTLLASPLARSMRRLTLRGLTPTASPLDLEGALAVIAAELPATCTELSLVDDRAEGASTMVETYYDRTNNLVTFGSLQPLWSMSHLESLALVVADPMQLELGTIDTPALRHFSLLGLVWAGGYQREQSALAATLAAATWPALESFETRLAETFTCSIPDNDGAYIRCEHYDDDRYIDEGFDEGHNDGTRWDTELASVLANLSKTKLVRLALHSFDSTRTLLETLLAAELPPTLEVLDLSESELSDRDAQWMLEHGHLFAGLRELDLRRTRIGARVVKQLDALGPTVHHSRGGAAHRFLVGME